MGKLKPTRVVTPRIVQPGHAGRSWVWAVIVVALALWTWQVFEFGRKQAGFDVGAHARAKDGLLQRIAELEAERDELRSAAAKFERTGQIDRAAALDVQSEVKSLQEERAELRREVAFLKTLVSGGSTTLALADHQLVELGQGRFEFAVTLSKQTDDNDTVAGKAVIRLKGIQDGVEKTLDMDAITAGKRSNIGIRFKNFQVLKTDITVPETFEPKQVAVSVEPTGDKFVSLEQVYDWHLAEE